jgi:hypothetical protein
MQLIKLRVSPEVVENPRSRTAFTITSDQRRQPRPLGPAIIRQPTAAQPTLHDDEAGAVLHALGLAAAELRRDQSLYSRAKSGSTSARSLGWRFRRAPNGAVTSVSASSVAASVSFIGVGEQAQLAHLPLGACRREIGDRGVTPRSCRPRLHHLRLR